jgi:hypothetical protein
MTDWHTRTAGQDVAPVFNPHREMVPVVLDLAAALPSSLFYKPVAMSSHRCRNSPVLPRLIYGSCMTWCTRQVIPGDDDNPPAVWHSVDVTGLAFGQPQTRSAGATSTDFLG